MKNKTKGGVHPWPYAVIALAREVNLHDRCGSFSVGRPPDPRTLDRFSQFFLRLDLRV